jgi:type II secretory pathway component GspD/PulD (secretin)
LSLSIGSLVTAGDLPVTSKNSILNKFSIKKGDVLLLAGISKDSLIDSKNGLPVDNLKSGFFSWIDKIFSQTSASSKNETFNVSIEVLK